VGGLGCAGELKHARFVYVDEYTCIGEASVLVRWPDMGEGGACDVMGPVGWGGGVGWSGCKNCALTAPETFFMEDEHGRSVRSRAGPLSGTRDHAPDHRSWMQLKCQATFRGLRSRPLPALRVEV
jgi:ferredoxin